MIYLTTTISPMMIKPSCVGHGVIASIEINEYTYNSFIRVLKEVTNEMTSAVGHENTAIVLNKLLPVEVKFNRINLELEVDDVVFAIVPQARADKAMEFSDEIIASSNFRYFIATVNC